MVNILRFAKIFRKILKIPEFSVLKNIPISKNFLFFCHFLSIDVDLQIFCKLCNLEFMMFGKLTNMWEKI